MITKERTMIAVLLALLVWFGAAIIRLENFDYAAASGMCSEHLPKNGIAYIDCLNHAQTRTNPLWHLVYGLRLTPW